MHWVVALIALAASCLTTNVAAHQATPGVVALKEVAPGRFLFSWSPPTPAVDDLRIHFPAACRCAGKSVFDASQALTGVHEELDCGGAGLAGTIEFATHQATLGRIAVNVEWLDGKESLLLSSGSPATVSVREAAGAQGSFAVLRQYVGFGMEHIWLGVDHLLFLLGLLLLVRGFKSALLTVSAFTVAHSLTLALAALKIVTVPTGPVEICIALSVLLLAVEITRGQDAFTRRWPWLVAFAFGLLHGLGFASALSEVGLPAHAVTLALFGFNLGVELGQMTVVGVVALANQFLRSELGLRTRLAGAATWVLGTCSVYWLLQRVVVWLGGLGVLA